MDCSVVVFENRPLSLSGKLSLPEYVYQGTVFNPADNTITIDYTATGLRRPVPGRVIGFLTRPSYSTQRKLPTTSTQHAYFLSGRGH